MKSGADASAGTLGEQAQAFADRLTNSVHAVAAECKSFTSKAIHTGDGPERFGVLQEPDTGVPLTVDGATLLTLKVKYFCTWDGHEQFLAVERSDVKVFAGDVATGEPLFRYEYVRKPGRDHPGAHIQVHAHRDAIAHVMGNVGRSTTRARRRAHEDDPPRMSDLHFPVGGPRFRPCLEDVLEMLVCELGGRLHAGGTGDLARGACRLATPPGRRRSTRCARNRSSGARGPRLHRRTSSRRPPSRDGKPTHGTLTHSGLPSRSRQNGI